MFERWRVQVCLDSRGSDSYFILYVNKDGAATGADPAPPRGGKHNIILLLFTPTSVLHVAKIFFYKKYLRNVENICYCRLLAGESRVIWRSGVVILIDWACPNNCLSRVPTTGPHKTRTLQWCHMRE